MVANPNADPYRAWLSIARRRKRMTQKQVAKAVGVSLSAYCKYEYGLRSPCDAVARRICQVLALNASEEVWSTRGKNALDS